MRNDAPVILGIDDNKDNLIILHAIIKEMFPKAKVITTQNGIDGIKMAKIENPDVILLDIKMPRIDGYEVCQRLKNDDDLNHIPVLFLTALKMERDLRIKALEVGAEGFLSKPIDDVELMAQIKAMIKIKEVNNLKRIEKEKLTLMVFERTKKLNEELKKRQKSEEELIQNKNALKERVKELNCLTKLSSLTTQPGITLDKLFRETVKLIQPAWQYPEITCSRIIFGTKKYKSRDFKVTKWKQSSDIKIEGKKRGTAEVYYLKKMPVARRGSFLKRREESN